ncbi:MAG: hypothetical protein GTO46_10155 [Gemmatimonadetes bacterium]|nr:hypothetical protein [Gemmatimonadota bacterium]NIO31965.1 hypothetical protein [Gemmatimonadota bacterium]
MRRFGAARLLVAVVALGCLACGDDGPSEPPPGAGDLVVNLISPHGDEGAAVFETSDAGITGVDCDGCDVYHNRVGGTSRIVVLMDISGDLSFTMSVADRQSHPELQVIEVADPSNQARDDVSQYAVGYSW